MIVGGRFAGVHACKALDRADVQINSIDKRNFNLFQPLLYQVSTGLVSSGDIATPLRELFGKQSNVYVLLGEVTNIHPESKQNAFNGEAYSYDHLVLSPDCENRISLSIKWISALLTQQRAAILLTGMPSKHMASKPLSVTSR